MYQIPLFRCEVKQIKVNDACEYNAMWHSKLPIIKPSNVNRNKYRICYGMFDGDDIIAVAILSSPVNPTLAKQPIIELRRLANSPVVPHNGATWFLSRIIKALKKDIPDIQKVISYQDTSVHAGIIYRAGNWVLAHKTKFASWNHATRQRDLDQSKADKIRWEYDILK